MFSPFSLKVTPVRAPEREAPPATETSPRFTFRPPTLTEVAVVADPFERAGPRLRVMEFFSRELSS
jgi:hypothetical protein